MAGSTSTDAGSERAAERAARSTRHIDSRVPGESSGAEERGAHATSQSAEESGGRAKSGPGAGGSPTGGGADGGPRLRGDRTQKTRRHMRGRERLPMCLLW